MSVSGKDGLFSAAAVSAPAAAGLSLKKATLIYNPVAGRRPAKREREILHSAEVLRGAGLEVEFKPTKGPDHAQGLAQSAANHGADIVLVCGGDGTINEVINGLTPSQVPLGILPGGTANILARELRLPLSPVSAARQLARWMPRRIALGRARWGESRPLRAGANSGTFANCRHFVAVAGIGYDAHIVYKLSAWLKDRWGVAGYVFEALRQWIRYGFPRFSCRSNGYACDATFAVVHRTRLYAGWLHMAPKADLYAPHFAVCSFASPRRARYLLYAMAVLMRQHQRLVDVVCHEGTTVECTPTDDSATVRFELDGELVGTLPATFEIMPDALTLLVP